MKIDIYGRVTVEVLKEADQWIIYKVADGKKIKAHDIVIPSHYDKNEVLTFLADMYHEVATLENPELKIIE